MESSEWTTGKCFTLAQFVLFAILYTSPCGGGVAVLWLAHSAFSQKVGGSSAEKENLTRCWG